MNYYFVDHLGSTRVMTDANGSVCFDSEYYPYGQEMNHTSTCNTSYKFTGYERHPETGNDYAFARYYNPRLGRFMSGDPLDSSADPSDPQSQNRYTYARNNPINFTDPTGMDCHSWGFADDWVDWNPTLCGDGVWEQSIIRITAWGTVSGDSSEDDGTSKTTDSNELTDAERWLIQQMSQRPLSNWQNTDQGGGGGGSETSPQTPAPTGTPSDKNSCATRLAKGVQQHTGTPTSDPVFTQTRGGHANYSFTVGDPATFQNVLNQNAPWPLPFGLDTGHRYGTVESTHILDPAAPGAPFTGHTDLFNGHSVLAPLHLLVDVAIGHIPGVNLDFGCHQ